jgi:hypothetical protein
MVRTEEYHLEQVNTQIPYSGKFSWCPIFAVFADNRLSAKIRPVK